MLGAPPLSRPCPRPCPAPEPPLPRPCHAPAPPLPRPSSLPTFLLVQPADAAAVGMRLQQQLSQKLPQVDGLPRAGRVRLRPQLRPFCATNRRVRGGAYLLILTLQKTVTGTVRKKHDFILEWIY